MDTSESQINVALLTSAYPLGRKDLIGGVEAATYYLSRGLSACPGVRVSVFVACAGRYGYSAGSQFEQDGVIIYAIPPGFKKHSLLSYFLFNPAAVVSHQANAGFHLIHVQNEALWAARAPWPKVLTIHGINEKDTLFRGSVLTRRIRSWANRFLQNLLRRQVPNIIIISPYVRQVFKPSPRQRLWDIDNPVADAFFDVVREPVAGRILFAGAICPRKNVTGLIEGFSIATRKKSFCELRLAGAETVRPYASRCRELAAQL